MKKFIFFAVLLCMTAGYALGASPYPAPTYSAVNVQGATSTGTLGVTGLATLSGGIAIGGTSTGTLAGAGMSLNLGTGAGDFASIGATTPGTGAFTTLSATGTITQSGTFTWSGGFPGANNLGIYQPLTISGTPTAGFAYGTSASLPLNLIYDQDTIDGWTGSASLPVSALQIEHTYGGGSSDGGRQSLLVESQLTGTIGTHNQFYVAAQINSKMSGNVSGATSGSPLGAAFGLGVNQIIASGSYFYESGNEFDYTGAIGSVTKYQQFLKFVNYSPGGWAAQTDSAFLRFESAYGALSNEGLVFGDPQASGNVVIATTASQGSAGTGLTFTANDPDLNKVGPGDAVSGTDIAAGTTVSAVDVSAGTVTLSASTTAAVPSATNITFGNTATGGFPITPTGTMIYSYAGTAGVGLDFSRDTFGSAFIKGPNGFQVDNDSTVHTNTIVPPNGTQLTVAVNSEPVANFKADASAVNYIELHATASGNNPFIFGTGTGTSPIGLNFQTGSANGVFAWFNSVGAEAFQVNNVAGAVSFLDVSPAATGDPSIGITGGTAANLLLGNGTALATTATAGFVRIPGMAGASTGNIVNVSAAAPAVWIDTTNKKICYEVVAGTPECSAAFTP